MSRARSVVVVNRHAIRANRAHGRRDPVLSVRSGRAVGYGHEAVVYSPGGEECGRFVYRPGRPLSCGAEVFFRAAPGYRVEPLVREGGDTPPDPAPRRGPDPEGV